MRPGGPGAYHPPMGVPTNSVDRFTDRAADYRRHRPGYPPALADDLAAAGLLAAGAVVADVGSGTGLLARVFLGRGHRVYGVEPNAAMRAAAGEDLRGFPAFVSVAGTAEQTTLPDAGVDLVVAGQAFHWFDPAPARQEFRRVLRPGGACALVWNDRRGDTPFLRGYAELLRTFSLDYAKADHRGITDALIASFFAPNPVDKRTYLHSQRLDRAGLCGRLLSSSHTPPAGHPAHGPMLAAVDALFDAYQEGGDVSFDYVTVVYAGRP